METHDKMFIDHEQAERDQLELLKITDPAEWRREVAQLAVKAAEREQRDKEQAARDARAKVRAEEAAIAKAAAAAAAAARAEAEARDRAEADRDPQRLAAEVASLLNNPFRRAARGTNLAADVAALRQDVDLVMKWIVATRNRETGQS